MASSRLYFAIRSERQAEHQALDELAALEHTLAQTVSKASALKQAIDELEQFQNRLHSG